MTNNTQTPLVSIVTSVYNGGRYLKETIESILNQTYTHFEFFIVDDASTDNSVEIVASYSDKRIIHIKNELNRGVPVCINQALEMASGKYIAKADADDICLPNRLAEQVFFMETHPEIDLLGSDVDFVDENGKKTLLGKTIPNHSEIAKQLEIKNCIYHPTIFFRNAADIRYREKFRYAQDYDFYLCLLSKGKKMANLNKILVKYRVGSSSISFSKTIEQQLFADKARSFYFERKKKGVDTYDDFDVLQIKKMSESNQASKSVLQALIVNNFKLNNLSEAKKQAKLYFNLYGYNNKYLFYYIAVSFKLRNIALFLFNLKQKIAH